VIDHTAAFWFMTITDVFVIARLLRAPGEALRRAAF